MTTPGKAGAGFGMFQGSCAMNSFLTRNRWLAPATPQHAWDSQWEVGGATSWTVKEAVDTRVAIPYYSSEWITKSPGRHICETARSNCWLVCP
jgi:hypothetical protein